MVGRPKRDPMRAERILAVAHGLFDRYGYEKTTLDDIAKAAEIGKGTLYLEFDSKEDIMMGCIERFQRYQIDLMKRSIQTLENQNPEKAQQELKTVLTQMLLDNILSCFDAVSRSIHSPEALALTSQRVRMEMRPYFEEKLGLIKHFLEHGVVLGLFRPLDNPHDQAYMMMMSLSCFFPPYGFYNTREAIEHDAPRMIGWLLDGLSPQIQPEPLPALNFQTELFQPSKSSSSELPGDMAR